MKTATKTAVEGCGLPEGTKAVVRPTTSAWLPQEKDCLYFRIETETHVFIAYWYNYSVETRRVSPSWYPLGAREYVHHYAVRGIPAAVEMYEKVRRWPTERFLAMAEGEQFERLAACFEAATVRDKALIDAIPYRKPVHPMMKLC